MFVKKIELFGFKTFAEKTEVELSDGITCIVGPNGCGKTNIADGLMWVLGESNVRNIRGQRSTDVIFNGSEKRRALGLAEVSIILDNACGTLPLSFNEVKVTRRAYRSGESEYLINGAKCRLKDIYELFLDTGIGREAYSMVTQGEIDAILSVKPEDRRELLEEAAGIKKYRYRRQEALRKLEKTEANLRRVRDIMSELECQLEPLEQQAQEATRFGELTSALREIEVGILIRDIKRIYGSLSEIRAGKIGQYERIIELNEQIESKEAERVSAVEELSRVEEELENARLIEQGLVEKTQRLSSRQALVKQKLESMSASRQQLAADIADIERRISEARERLAGSETSQESCSAATEAARAAVESQRIELEQIESAIADASRLINEQKSSYLELAKNLAAKRNSLQHARERVEQLGAAVERYGRQIAEAEGAAAQSEESRSKATAEVESGQAQLQELAKKSEALSEERKSVERNLSEKRSQASEVSRDIAARSSRFTTLKEMAEVHEGFFEGVRNVIGARKDGRLHGEYHVVADVLDVPKGYETAVEVALGANLQDIITPSVDEAKQAIEYLKSARAGRATFLPLDGMRPSDHRIRGDWKRIRGAIGIAADLVGYDSRFDAAIRSLLGRTIMTETIDDAIAVSRSVDGWNKIVTLEGEIIVPSGAIAGGAMKSRTQGILLRKQEIETLGAEIKALETDSGKVQARIAELEARLAEISSETADLGKQAAVGRDALESARQRLDRASEEEKRTARQIQSLRIELEETSRLREEQAQTAAQVESELQTGGVANSDLDRRVAEAEGEIAALEAKRTAARERLLSLNVELASASERSSSISQSMSDTARVLADLTQSLETRTRQATGQDEEEARLSEEAGVIGPEMERQQALLEAAQTNSRTLQERRHKTSEQAKVLDQEVRETTNVRNKISQSAHDADVKEARLDAQLSQATQRLSDEYEMGLEAALEWPEDELSIERGTATEVARLRREIKEMGPVNTGAVQEYERIKERWDFLVAQRTDLESAGEQIGSAIGEIDMNTHDRFMETFNTVAANFDVMFKRLFSGGRTELTLTDPSDLLETGIEVCVQPPGKKMQDLALLSGGERALTATALIFALLKAKPSPFVVMDELDAPLDETNVERFADVLQEFARDSQFIVVTHNRATMEAAANLYGVTMQEPGISRLLSVKLSSESVEGEVEPVAAAVT